MITTDNIYSLCYQFRLAVLSIPVNERIEDCKVFPLGACGVSDLLGAFLFRELGVCTSMVVGEYCDKGELKSHTWLTTDDLLIDITADQFKSVNTEVIVADCKLIKSNYHLGESILIDSEVVDDRIASFYLSVIEAIEKIGESG